MSFINYQLYIYPSPIWMLQKSGLPLIIKNIVQLLKHGYIFLIVFGAFSNIAAFIFSISILKQHKTAIVFTLLAVVDLLSVFMNLLPRYLDVLRIKNIDQTDIHHNFIEIVYKEMVKTTPELQSTLNCKILAYFEAVFRSISSWLIVAMTYFRLLSISSPFTYGTKSIKYFLRRCVLIMAVVLVLHSFPLFTKTLIIFDLGLLKIKLCHHKNLLGIGFYHFEHAFTSLVFPILPCVVIVVLNILLIFHYQKSTRRSIASSISNSEI